MAILVKPYTFSAGATIIAAQHNSNFDTLFNDYNGNIDNTNISNSANIADTKLGQITTGNKVNGTALSSLASITSAAGIIPVINLASGTTGSSYYFKGDGTWAAGNTANQAVILDSNSKLSTNVAGIFTDRGNATGFDFTKTNLTTDGAWHDLILPAFVPASSLVLLRIDINDGTVGNNLFQARTKGNADVYNTSPLRTQSGYDIWKDMQVYCDANKTIEYNASNIVWNTINITVGGWWR